MQRDKASFILILGDYEMRKNGFRIFSVVIFFVAMVLLTVIAIPLIRSLGNPSEFKAFIDSCGPWGFGMMLFIQVSQIVVALIPGEFVEFVAGTVYGWLGGLLFCLFGIAVGQTIIFFLVKFWGKDFAENVAGSKAVSKFKFLQDEKKLRTIIFFLFFVPGTPKDLITYLVPLTKIKFADFLVITLFARIPSVLSSTYAGDAFSNKDFLTLAITYGAIIVFSVAGVICYRIWDEKRMERLSKKNLGNKVSG